VNIFQAYPALGVHRQSDDGDIKAAHKRLAMKYHPDRPDGDPVRFMEVQQAYELLKGVPPLGRIRQLEILGEGCDACSTSGIKAKRKGYRVISVSACERCKGAGYIERETRS